MADGLNRATLLGNLGADPELRILDNGTGMLKLRLATSESWFSKEKNAREEKTEWHQVTMWGGKDGKNGRVEALSKLLRKGDRVYVEGQIQTRTYEKEGQKHYATEIRATNVLLCGSKAGSSARPSGGDDLDRAAQDAANRDFSNEEPPF